MSWNLWPEEWIDGDHLAFPVPPLRVQRYLLNEASGVDLGRLQHER
jgi:hypothetical protein